MTARRSNPRQRLAEIAGYLGGGLMLDGATLLVATSWAGDGGADPPGYPAAD
ncbi:MAG TPA: hypothetical protein VFV67_30135 [Actinophytocola sp.]|uniref:hypothetical protein n=1 Tax=Actinophytocola sp. TaxID=1872138 RepID=UPI002DBDB122|nr:hypothetical protein [Actinophytocola sp.]HEU5474923.1 hypothetical protein [Actinophytocola sp.]